VTSFFVVKLMCLVRTLSKVQKTDHYVNVANNCLALSESLKAQCNIKGNCIVM